MESATAVAKLNGAKQITCNHCSGEKELPYQHIKYQ